MGPNLPNRTSISIYNAESAFMCRTLALIKIPVRTQSSILPFLSLVLRLMSLPLLSRTLTVDAQIVTIHVLAQAFVSVQFFFVVHLSATTVMPRRGWSPADSAGWVQILRGRPPAATWPKKPPFGPVQGRWRRTHGDLSPVKVRSLEAAMAALDQKIVPRKSSWWLL